MSHIDPRYCRDFLHGSCDRVNCRYEHATVAELMTFGEDVGRLIFCRDFQRSNCFRPGGTCRFIHATTRDEQYYRTYKMLPPHLQNVPSSISPALRNPAQIALVEQQYLTAAGFATHVPGVLLPAVQAVPVPALPQQAPMPVPALDGGAMMPPGYNPATFMHPAYPMAPSPAGTNVVAAPAPHSGGGIAVAHSQSLMKPNPVVHPSVTSLYTTPLVHPSQSLPLLPLHPLHSNYPAVGNLPPMQVMTAGTTRTRADVYNQAMIYSTPQPLLHQVPAHPPHRPPYVAYPPQRRIYPEPKHRVRLDIVSAGGSKVDGEVDVSSNSTVPSSALQYHSHDAQPGSSMAAAPVSAEKPLVSSVTPSTTSVCYSTAETVYSTAAEDVHAVATALELLKLGESAVAERKLGKDTDIGTSALESSTEETCA